MSNKIRWHKYLTIWKVHGMYLRVKKRVILKSKKSHFVNFYDPRF